MTDTNYYLSMLRASITWLEKYIEVANYYPDWKQRKQTDTSVILWVKEDTPKEKVLHNVGTHLTLSFEAMLDEEPLTFRKELKNEFYKWLDTSQINLNNAPVELKCALFDFHEILGCRFEKAQKDRANRKREIEIDSPEYLEQMQKVFSESQQAISSGKVNPMDASRFKGSAEAGKKSFEAMANSLTAEEKDNFHFWPQMSEEEKLETNHKHKEPPIDSILQTWRTNSIKEIADTLHQEPQLTNTDLELKNQNWKEQINQTKDIIKIQAIKEAVLHDVRDQRRSLLCRIRDQKITKTWLLGGGIFLAGLILVGLVYYLKKNVRRK